ncbi:MAG: tRNA (N(6)-L-threonylcarbamoyladenosine(37)-C(2))-methylthiotransferase, partial [Candidatus Altiarchaeota archaeon]
ERIVGLLLGHGFDVGDNGEVVVVNTCTVKSPTESKIRKRLRELSAKGRSVVVAGCIPAADQSIVEEFPVFSFIGTNVSDVVAAVEATASGGRYVNIGSSGDKMCIPKVRANPIVEIVPILEGCLGSCSYCIVRKARGALKSYPMADIVGRVREAVSEGVREIWLTSQDNSAYGKDADSTLPELLRAVSEVEGEFMVRVGMANPNHVAGFLDELVDAFTDERIYRFLHVPVQSGSDTVLSEMGRRYIVDDFKAIVDAFRKRYDATISTDVIAGYPTETEEAFQETISLIKEVEPDVLNVSRFWARPGTEAAKLKQLPGRETKRRSRILNEVFEKVGFERNSKWVGWRGTALASEKNADGTYTCRNSHYKPIVIKSGKDVFGRFVNVEVREATYFDLRGKIHVKELG